MRLAIFFSALIVAAPAVASEFDHPWNAPGAALVLDPYHANVIDWDKSATDRRVVAIIHKSTGGTNTLDPAYFARRAEARKRGYLWGSYHWGTAGAPERQADFYIETIKPRADELIALDLDDPSSRRFMQVDEALRFIRRVKARVGRDPVLYANRETITRYAATLKAAHVPLWYARGRGEISDFPLGAWRTYTLWQFSSEQSPRIAIAGTHSDMDVSVFNGPAEQLRAAWPFTRAAP